MDFSLIPLASANTVTPILDANASYSTSDMLRIAIALLVLVAMICSVFFIVYGGLMLVLSGWKDDRVDSARKTINYAVIGLVVMVVAIFLVPVLTSLLWLGKFEYLSPQSISDTVRILTEKIFGASSSSFTPSSASSGKDLDFTNL